MVTRSFLHQVQRAGNSTPHRGLQAKRNGQSSEEVVDSTARQLLALGIAEINKRYEPYKRVSSSNGSTTFKGVYLGKSGCDYEVFLRDGRAGHMEVKSREGARIELSAVDPLQAAQLTRRVTWGQLAWVLVRLSGEWFIVPWARFIADDQGQPYARKSHNAEQLKQIGFALVEADGVLNLADFWELM